MGYEKNYTFVVTFTRDSLGELEAGVETHSFLAHVSRAFFVLQMKPFTSITTTLWKCERSHSFLVILYSKATWERWWL